MAKKRNDENTQVEPIGSIVKKLVDSTLRRSVQSLDELELLIPRNEFDNYEWEVTSKKIKEGMRINIRRLKRKKGGD